MRRIVIVRNTEQKWGKGSTVEEAVKNGKLGKGHKMYISTLSYSDALDVAGFSEIEKCWSINIFGELVFADDATAEDIHNHKEYYRGLKNEVREAEV